MSLPEPKRQDTRLDRYHSSYSDRTHGMRASAVRALFAVANRPEVVSLAGGMPNIADLPLDVVANTLGAALGALACAREGRVPAGPGARAWRPESAPARCKRL